LRIPTKHGLILAFEKSYRHILLAIIAFIIAIPSYSQNTKGDKPASNQGSILRIPRLKSKKKGGDKAYTGDVSGRRIRTKNKSSAVRAIETKSLPYRKKRPAEVSRVGRPIGGRGTRVIIRSSTAKAARNNVYPSQGEFAYNPSKKPHDTQRAYPNSGVLARVASWITKREPPGSKKRITPRSASGSFITRGRRNVYWGKLRKGEKPITTDLTGRGLRAKNFHSPGLGGIPANEVYKRKKRPADRPYKGTFSSGYATSAQRSRAWTGDITGHAIRTRPPKTSQTSGIENYSDYVSNSTSQKRFLKSIRVRRPEKGIGIFKRFLDKFQGKRNPLGGGSVSKGFNNSGRPINVRPPGIGANMGDYKGNLPGGGKTFSQQGLGFSGNIKSRRQTRGGGSVSGRVFNNRGRAINVRPPGIGANMGDYKGNLQGGGKVFSQQGLGFSGNIKSRRQAKGGGSISGSWNNKNQSINVRTAGIGAKFVGQYQGFFRRQRVSKGGGSISGSWNNGGQPIDVRAAAAGAGNVGTYTGFVKPYDLSPGFAYQGETYKGSMKAKRLPKGGGSVSGSWNNKGNPLERKSFSPASLKIGIYTGNLRAKRQEKGGGSISGSWNNRGEPLERKSFSPAALKIGTYAGNLKAKRPEKGGGTISGKVWNNNQQAVLARTPLSQDAKDAGYSGRIRLPLFRKKYISSPHSDKEALKKIRPDRNTYVAGGLQIKVRQKEYEHNKISVKGAIKGMAPGKNSVKASEYDGHMKVMWAFKHNPSSREGALKSRRPTNFFSKENQFAGKLTMKKYVHNPRSNKNALEVIGPSQAMARIKDYQGNLKMSKSKGRNLHPDAQFAHSDKGNVKRERTLLMNIRLTWAKLFKRNSNQPNAVKEKVRRPRYDKKEKELWKDLYD